MRRVTGRRSDSGPLPRGVSRKPERDREMDQRVRPLVDRVWNYHKLNHELAKSDVIVVLCSHDTVVAERGAQLWLEGWAPLLVFSGGLGAITRRFWSDPEADRFA